MVSFPAVLGRDVLANADGVAASTGSACHSGLDTPSTTLLAMGVPREIALGSVRLSLGHATTSAAVATAADILVGAYGTATSAQSTRSYGASPAAT